MNKKKLIIALGCNANKEKNMACAKEHLCGLFGDDIIFTPPVETEPIGIASGMFTNCLASIYTTLDMREIEPELKTIERLCTDTHDKRTKNIVEMDIDILEFAGKKYHEKDWERPYVNELLKQVGI